MQRFGKGIPLNYHRRPASCDNWYFCCFQYGVPPLR